MKTLDLGELSQGCPQTGISQEKNHYYSLLYPNESVCGAQGTTKGYSQIQEGIITNEYG